jgi:hypothetical protein
VASEWVSKEVRLALESSAKNGQPQIIPVQLEAVDMDRVHPSLRPMNWVDLTRTTETVGEEMLRRLLRRIGVPDADAIPSGSLKPLISMRASTLRVFGMDDVLTWGWDAVRLCEEFVRLDNAVNDVHDPNHEGAIKHEGEAKQWAPIFRHHPNTWRMLASEPKKIAGYWHIAPLFEPDYRSILSGALFDSDITVDRIPLFELAGKYKVYLSQVCMLPELRKKPANIQFLFETFFDVLEELSDAGIFIEEVAANAVTPDGERMCKRFKMKEVCVDRYGGKIHTAQIQNFLEDFIGERFPEMRDRYAAEGLYTPRSKGSPPSPRSLGAGPPSHRHGQYR